jgi:hypothetical protein
VKAIHEEKLDPEHVGDLRWRKGALQIDVVEDDLSDQRILVGLNGVRQCEENKKREKQEHQERR